MRIKATHTQLIDVDINEQTAEEITYKYLRDKPKTLLNSCRIVFCKKHNLPLGAKLNTSKGQGNWFWEVYENYGSHYSGYERVKNQPPKEETEAFQEIVNRLYALFGTSLS